MSVGPHPLSMKLVREFQHLYSLEGAPQWAWQLAPSVPLVGRNYQPDASLLIYGSCENFGDFYGKKLPARFNDARVFDRYRAVHEERPSLPGEFFPWVGISPISSGPLMASALYVSQKAGLPVAEDPASFLQQISVSNVAKFPIHCFPNKDYAGDLRKVIKSLPYLVNELSILRPAVALVPSGYWRHEPVRAAMRGGSPFTGFLPVYQCNAGVVHRNPRLQALEGRAQELARSSRGSTLATWLERCRPRLGCRWWRYIAFLEAVLAENPPTSVTPIGRSQDITTATICASE